MEYLDFGNFQQTCPKCRWSGLGKETSIHEWFESGSIVDVLTLCEHAHRTLYRGLLVDEESVDLIWYMWESRVINDELATIARFLTATSCAS